MSALPVRRALVIKLGNFAEFVLAFGAFSAIRRHHTNAYITLLTTPSFAGLARKSGWFDEVWDDGKPRWRRIGRVARLIWRMRRARFDRVYDLDNSARTARYRFWMRDFWGNKAEWSRSTPGFLNLMRGPETVREHYVEQTANQLAEAGIDERATPDLSWLTKDFGGRYGLQDGFVLLAPGNIEAGADRCWPVARFAELARRIAIEGRRPVVIGTRPEERNNQLIAAASPDAMDLTAKTTLFDVAALAKRASVAVGNDSGIMHLIAAVGCPSVVLTSSAADAGRSGPRGRYVVMVRKENLSELPVTEVAAALRLG
ncbi:MAG: glycosyltransferase family 9 protein [Alphaproteobacteria bacterium]|nr:glycosyltransferase family 9 protein [Alphaproteobacteria bacterium]